MRRMRSTNRIRLRANEPLGVASPKGFDPFWVVTKHSDILEIGRNNALFPSGVRATNLNDRVAIDRAREITGAPFMLRTLVNMDDPDHRKYRILTQAWFMPAQIRRREEEITHIATAAVSRMAEMKGGCDFVRDVALHYPLHVVMSILGVPKDDFPRMLKLTQQLFGPQDPDVRRAQTKVGTVAYSRALKAVVDDFTAYFDTLTEDRRARPRDDLATVIANARIDGSPLPPLEATSYYIIVATAGHDTTSSSTSTAMWALATVPGLLQQLQNDLLLIPQLVEEAIRWATPVKTFMRSVKEDTRVRGRTLKRHDWLMLCYASGNRDEEVFDKPFEFKLDRAPNKQLAFGSGAHVCLGQHLARMEMRIFFETLIPRLKAIKIVGEPRLTDSWFVNGLKALPIEYALE